MSTCISDRQGQISRRQKRQTSRSLQALLLLFPAVAIVWFHKHLSKFGVHSSSEDYSFIPHLQFSHGSSTSRHLSLEDSKTTAYRPKQNVTTTAPVHASVPDSAREARGLPNLERQVNAKNRQRNQRRRRIQGKLPRRGSKRDVSAWVRHPENITSFSYIPVGKYVNMTEPSLTKRRDRIKTANVTSPYAFAFVMGGVNEDDGMYLGMFYNVLISAYILEKEGSKADIVLYVQMSANSTSDELPNDNMRLLEELGVRVRYLPKPKVENFHQIIMQKLVVMDLNEYQRAILLDTDVMPFCNLDYVFHLSDGPRPILKKNLIIALSGSPANAGFFMLSPRVGDLDRLHQIMAKQQERAKDLPYPHFDENRGWGHVIRPPDMWWTINKKHSRRRWKFVGSHADQGLLYHWVKYEKRSVSIVSGVEVDNYGPKNDHTRVRLEKTLKDPFKHHTCLPLKYEKTFGELPTFDARGMAPYRDFVHFLGGNKPWKKRLPAPVHTNIEAETPEQYWFHMLRLLNKELNMGLDFENWKRIRKTPLGSHPKKDLMVELMHSNQSLVQT